MNQQDKKLLEWFVNLPIIQHNQVYTVYGIDNLTHERPINIMPNPLLSLYAINLNLYDELHGLKPDEFNLSIFNDPTIKAQELFVFYLDPEYKIPSRFPFSVWENVPQIAQILQNSEMRQKYILMDRNLDGTLSIRLRKNK